MAGEINEIAKFEGKDIRDRKLADMTEVQQASSLPAVNNLKFILMNGTDEEFKDAVDTIIAERIRELFGPALNNLDKGQNVDLIPVIQKSGTSPNFSFDLGSTTPANLASVLSARLHDLDWKNVGWVETDQWTIVGPSRYHIYAIKCSTAGNGDGYYFNGVSVGLPFLTFDYYESTGELIMKSKITVSGAWYVKDLCV